MSALGHKQTFRDYPPNVRFRGKSGHIWQRLKESANSHKRTFIHRSFELGKTPAFQGKPQFPASGFSLKIPDKYGVEQSPLGGKFPAAPQSLVALVGTRVA